MLSNASNLLIGKDSRSIVLRLLNNFSVFIFVCCSQEMEMGDTIGYLGVALSTVFGHII